MAGLATTFGSGAMTNNIDDFANARCIFAIGTNTAEAHPVLAMKLRRIVRNSGAKLIVANPMEVDLVRDADLWIRLKYGTDVALLMGMCRIILDEGLHDASVRRGALRELRGLPRGHSRTTRWTACPRSPGWTPTCW